MAITKMEKTQVIPMDKAMVDILKMLIQQNQTIVETNKVILEHLSYPIMMVSPQPGVEICQRG